MTCFFVVFFISSYVGKRYRAIASNRAMIAVCIPEKMKNEAAAPNGYMLNNGRKYSIVSSAKDHWKEVAMQKNCQKIKLLKLVELLKTSK